MSLEKLLQKIKAQVRDLEPTLEGFTSDTVHPTVSDCEKLQQQLSLIQETVAVYKYNMVDKELSPSFNIHAKISVADTGFPKEPASDKANRSTSGESISRNSSKEASEASKTEVPKSPRTLSIGVNDKFRFINELFVQNVSEYNIAIEQLSNLKSWSEADLYLSSLKNLYGWKESSEPVKLFYSLVRKRFN